MKTPFLGGYGVGRSTNVEDCKLINLYLEIVEGKDGADTAAFYMCPGLDFLVGTETAPIRGMITFQNWLVVVAGTGVYTVTSSWVANKIGTISGLTNTPVSMIENGTQLAIFDGYSGYLVSSSGVLSTLTLPFSGPVIASYQEGFGLVNVTNSNEWFQSGSFDLSTWDALNFASADVYPTDIVTIVENHLEQWLFKTDGAEIWVNAGLSGFAFQRLPSVYVEVGCAAPYSACKVGESIMFLSQNPQGWGQVMQTRGYSPQRVSTHSIEREIQSYNTVTDAFAYSYQQEGHLFYVITFPTGNATWVYDATASSQLGYPIWHKRASLTSNGLFNRHWAGAYAFFNGTHVVGDYVNGNLYAYNLDTATDNGTRRKWLRTWRALPHETSKPIRFRELDIFMQAGIQVSDSGSPLLALRWSDDGGNTWSSEMYVSAGKPGQTFNRAEFLRLGSTSLNRGLDRIFELSSSDMFGVALIGADLK